VRLVSSILGALGGVFGNFNPFTLIGSALRFVYNIMKKAIGYIIRFIKWMARVALRVLRFLWSQARPLVSAMTRGIRENPVVAVPLALMVYDTLAVINEEFGLW